MTTEERAALKIKMEATIEETEAKIAQLQEATKPISPENSIGRISRMDAINNKSVAEAALRSAERKLASIKFALTKIDSPEFGNCSRCGNTIPAGRLMFMPHSTTCVRCAE